MENGQAIAYTTIAMSKLGYTQKEIEKVTNTMITEFNDIPSDQAVQRADEIIFGNR